MEEITVYLASMGISAENLKKFQKLADRYGRKLVILDTAKAERKMMEYRCRGWNGSLATWLRFFVLDQIPADVDRILWLDSDTIVKKSLKDLVDLPLENAPLAAGCDSLCYFFRFRLRFGYDDPYYNAGVLLFHLNLWRKENTLDKMMKHLQENVEAYELNDQDLLNDYFKGQIVKLPQKYNVQGFQAGYGVGDYYKVYPWTSKAYYTHGETQKAIQDPTIVHFFRYLGDYPWTAGHNYHPYKVLYESWKKRSSWSECPPAKERKERVFWAEKLLYNVLPKKAFLRVFRYYINRSLPKKPLKNMDP